MKNHITENNQTLRSSGWVLAVLGLGLLLTVASPAFADNGNMDNSQAFPPQSHPYGASYPEWAARYWQWVMSFPAKHNPGDGTAPQESAQSGKVWFLASSPNHQIVTRQITVPEGKALFFAALAVYENNAACPTPTTNSVEFMLNDLNGLWDTHASLTSVTIDGVPVAKLDNPQTTPYRLQTIFNVTVATHDNLFAGDCVLDGSTVPTVTVGAFLMVKPLSVGNHTIEIRGEAAPFLIKKVTYDITVKEDGD